MPRLRPCHLTMLALLAACGGPPHPVTTPLDELAAKPAKVQAAVDRAEAQHADDLKRQEAEADETAPEPQPNAESRR